jgi:hypothetical protein
VLAFSLVPLGTLRLMHYATGTFYIDPRNAIVKKRKKSAKQPVLPHASFRSRAGAIQLALGTAGIAKENPSASVQVASKTGNIEINLVCEPFLGSANVKCVTSPTATDFRTAAKARPGRPEPSRSVWLAFILGLL